MSSYGFLSHLTEFRYNFLTWQVFSTLCLALFTVIFLILFKYALFRRKYSQLWPGRKTRFLSLSGNLSDIQRNENMRNGFPNLVFLHEAIAGYMYLFKDKPFIGFWASFFPCVFTNKAETVEALIVGRKYMDKGWAYKWLEPWIGTGLLTSKGSKWKSRRKLMTPSFHSEVLKDFMFIFNKKANSLVKFLREETTKHSTDIVKPVTLFTLEVICETALGVPSDALRKKESGYVDSVKRACEIMFLRFGNILSYNNFIFNLTKLGKENKQAIENLHGFTMSVINEKKKKLLIDDQNIGIKKKRKPLLEHLLEHHIEMKSLTEKDIREEVDTFAFEGHDTVSMGISWSFYLIGLHRDVQDKIQEELYRIFGTDTERPVNTEDIKDMKYLDCVLKECLRLYPPVPFIARQITEDTTICGYPVPKETLFFINIHNLHRDERWFPNPEKFDPDRFLPENSANRHPYAYIPFSAGPRNCIGQRYAEMELKITVSSVLRHYTVESLDQRDKLPPSPEVFLNSPLPIRIKIRTRDKNLCKVIDI